MKARTAFPEHSRPIREAYREAFRPEQAGLGGVPPAILDAWRKDQSTDEDSNEFLTTAQIAAARKVSLTHAQRWVVKNAARLERRLVRRTGPSGRLVLVNVYRIKEAP